MALIPAESISEQDESNSLPDMMAFHVQHAQYDSALLAHMQMYPGIPVYSFPYSPQMPIYQGPPVYHWMPPSNIPYGQMLPDINQNVQVKEKKRNEKNGRQIFNNVQISALTDRFNKEPSIKKEERITFGKYYGLEERQIKIWFQNRRYKLKKQGPATKQEFGKLTDNDEVGSDDNSSSTPSHNTSTSSVAMVSSPQMQNWVAPTTNPTNHLHQAPIICQYSNEMNDAQYLQMQYNFQNINMITPAYHSGMPAFDH